MTSLIDTLAAISMSFTGEIDKIFRERVCARLLPLHPVAKARWAVGGGRRLPNHRGFISARRNEKARHEAGGETTKAATLCARCREANCNGTIAAELSSCSVTVSNARGDLIMASVMATKPMTRFVPDGYGPAGPRR